MADARITTNTGRDIWVLIFLEDGRHLLSGGREGVIRQWRIEDGNLKEVEDQRLTASGHSEVTAIALSADGNWIVSGGEGVVAVLNRHTRQSASTAREHSSWVNDVHVSPDSTKFATASTDGSAIIWNIFSGRPLTPPLRHSSRVTSVRFSPDGSRIATAVYGGEVRMHDTYSGQLLSNIPVASLPSFARAIAWSGTQHIYVLSSGNVFKHIFVDTGSFKLLSEWTSLGRPWPYNYGSIALSNNGKFIASFVGRSVTFWDTSTHTQFGPVFDHPQAPNLHSIALSPDNNFLATGGWGGIITLHNLTGVIPSSHRVTGNASTTTLTPQRIPDGKYRIKSNTGELYLTGPQGGANTITVQPSSQSNDQKWTLSLVVHGAYNITSTTGASLTVGIRNMLVAGRRGTTWTFEPRGDAYVIGNAVNASAIQLAFDRQSVSVFPRDNTANQRWVLVPVTN